MKKTILFLAFVVLMLSITSCNRVAPNYEGVLMKHYGANGKDDYSSVTGNQGILGFGSELFQVPMYEQTADVEAITVRTQDGGAFSTDPKYTYEPIRGTGVDIIFNYKHVGATGDEAMMDNIETRILSPLVLNSYRDVARKYSTDSMMFNMARYEQEVQDTLTRVFERKYFKLTSLTSGLVPPESMREAIEARNNAKIRAEQVQNEQEIARMELEKARIEQQTNQVKSQGLTKEILQQQWINAIQWSHNKVIITDGRTPIILGQ
jgi:SPFH domain / Band 7 family